MLVVKNEQLDKHPWLAEELFSLFQTARRPYVAALRAGAAESPADRALLAMSRLVGDDPIPYGFEGSRTTLETFVGFNVEQQVIPRWVDPAAIFAQTTIGLS
jgi:4,5-dihydroxyphthalate decarboxylase